MFLNTQKKPYYLYFPAREEDELQQHSSREERVVNITELDEMFGGPFIKRAPKFFTMSYNKYGKPNGVIFPRLNTKEIIHKMVSFFIVNKITPRHILSFCHRYNLINSVYDFTVFMDQFFKLQEKETNSFGFCIKENKFALTDQTFY